MASGTGVDLAEVYDRFAETYSASRGVFDMSEVLAFLDARLGAERGRLLDLGCGAGEPFPAHFLARGWEVSGVDFSRRMLGLAATYAPAMRRIHGDFTEAEFEPESFDAITCIYSLFHVPTAKHPGLFAKFRRWLRPGGKAFFTYATKEYTGLEEFEGYKEFMGQSLFYSHVRPAALRAQLEGAGLAVESEALRDIGGESFLWVLAARR
jgi:SAM-dependent methyltransferase